MTESINKTLDYYSSGMPLKKITLLSPELTYPRREYIILFWGVIKIELTELPVAPQKKIMKLKNKRWMYSFIKGGNLSESFPLHWIVQYISHCEENEYQINDEMFSSKFMANACMWSKWLIKIVFPYSVVVPANEQIKKTTNRETNADISITFYNRV